LQFKKFTVKQLVITVATFIQQCMRFQVLSMRAWDWPHMRESHTECTTLDRSVCSSWNFRRAY